MSSVLPRFVLLDRDGVINQSPDDDGYITDPALIKLIPGTAEAIAGLNGAGFEVAVCSNQQCVGKGLLSLADLDRISETVRERIETESGGRIREFFYCPHLKAEHCECRKPAPGLILKARKALGFDLAATYYIGDAFKDIDAADRAGCKAIFVLSGQDRDWYEAGKRPKGAIDFVAHDLQGAVRWILKALRDES